MKYYRIGLLGKTPAGAEWDHVYFKVGEGRSEIVHYVPQSKRPLNLTIESIPEEDVESILSQANRDFGH